MRNVAFLYNLINPSPGLLKNLLARGGSFTHKQSYQAHLEEATPEFIKKDEFPPQNLTVIQWFTLYGTL